MYRTALLSLMLSMILLPLSLVCAASNDSEPDMGSDIENSTVGIDQETDLSLFNIIQSNERYALMLLKRPDEATVTIGGGVQFDTQTSFGDDLKATESNETGGIDPDIPNNATAVSLTSANLAVNAHLRSFLSLLASFETSVIPGDNGDSGVNAKIILLNVGNLQKQPFYLSAGSAPVDFTYFEGTGPFFNTLISDIYQTDNQPQVEFGFYNTYIDASFTVFSPTSYDNDASKTNFSTLLAGHFDRNQWNILANIGYLYDLRGTGDGFDNSIDSYTGETPSLTSVWKVGGHIQYRDFQLIGSYNSTLQDQAITNYQTMHGFTLGTQYFYHLIHRDSSLGVTYSNMQNNDHVGSALPSVYDASMYGIKHNIIVYSTISLFSNINAALEYNRNVAHRNGAGDRVADNAITLDLQAFV